MTVSTSLPIAVDADPNTQRPPASRHASKPQLIKCVVWDLDNTLWDGVLLEGGAASLRPRVLDLVRTLDGRGVLNSIASRNDVTAAVTRLQELGIDEYFLAPQISWSSKVQSIAAIAEQLNISFDAIAFVDDDPVEREEVATALPDVRCIDAADFASLATWPEATPATVTRDAAMRRRMYAGELQRKQAEEEFVGPKEAFLANLDMVVRISPARDDDLARAEELTVRTHQLNTTGYTYSYDQLDAFRRSPDHLLLVTELTDKYGPYGAIGLALVECRPGAWTVKLLLMSCRVIARGIGGIVISHIARLARDAGARLLAEFVPTGRNRMMYLTYKWMGFREVEATPTKVLFEHGLTEIAPFPPYVRVEFGRPPQPSAPESRPTSRPGALEPQ